MGAEDPRPLDRPQVRAASAHSSAMHGRGACGSVEPARTFAAIQPDISSKGGREWSPVWC